MAIVISFWILFCHLLYCACVNRFIRDLTIRHCTCDCQMLLSNIFLVYLRRLLEAIARILCCEQRAANTEPRHSDTIECLADIRVMSPQCKSTKYFQCILLGRVFDENVG